MKNRYLSITCMCSLLVILLAGFINASQAQILPPQPISGPANTIEKNSPLAKIGADLVSLKAEYEEFVTKKNARTVFEPANKFIQVRGGYVVIDAVAETTGESIIGDLEAIGMEQAVAFGKVVSGIVPIRNIEKLAAVQHMRFARPAYKPINHIGFVDSEGDKAQRSDLAKADFGVDGTGIKVGILSDSYNNLTGERISVLTGDLPGPENPNDYTAPVEVLSELAGGGIDEGRAMMEIIHDVAPGAEMAFHTAFNGQADFARGILRLQDAGCKVIVDDIFYFAEPFFQDGIIAQAVDQAVEKGATYFSSAGNAGRGSYESAFQPSGIKYVEGEAHSFAEGDQFQRITIPFGSTFILSFQWDEPYFSVSGGKGAETDMDIYLVNDSLTRVVSSGSFNNIGNDPYEIIVFTNNTSSSRFNLMIEKNTGPAPKLMKYVIFRSSSTINEYSTFSSTIVGHSNAAGAIAVGAAPYWLTPAFGVNAPGIETFSSQGGTPILFDKLGNRIEPLVRQKPEVTSADGVNTTFFFPGLDFEEDGFPNFFGTSASAPHAAGVAALMMELAEADLQASQVREILQNTALDMDNPGTPGFDTGFDFRTGYGLIRADMALEKVLGEQRVSSFMLINADNGKDIMEITEGMQINLAALPTRNLHIRANTVPANVGSIVFDLNGRKVIENVPPYVLNNYEDGVNKPVLMAGNYTLTAVPFTQQRGDGEKGLALTVNFSVVNQAVVSFTLVNADNSQDIMEITEGMQINLGTLPTWNLNIRANTVPARVGSVVFNFNERTVIENAFPYALGGDSHTELPLTYKPLSPPLTRGFYVLSATPYSESRGTGEKGGTLLVRFNMVGTPPVAQAGIGIDDTSKQPLRAFPNPSYGKFIVQYINAGDNTVSIKVYNNKGELMQNKVSVDSSGAEEAAVDVSKLPDGLYVIKVDYEGFSQMVKVVKQ